MTALRQSVRRIVRRFGYDVVRVGRWPHPSIPESFPPGHFYSVVPSLAEVTERAPAIFAKSAELHGIGLNLAGQIRLLREFAAMAETPPFYSPERRRRFNIENNSFSYDDAPILHYMIRRLRPRRIIEIGSGNSSACMLDTSELHLGGAVEFTFIDPDCGNLRRNLLAEDFLKVRILERPVQEVDRGIFTALRANDLLFIDSSHVIKAGSDLCTILFEVLPVLAPGVCIHFHDIRYPFQYERETVLNGVFWNEAYLLRALLMYNSSFAITFWLNCLVNVKLGEARNLLERLPLPEWDRRFNDGAGNYSSAGGSIYLTKRL